MFNGTSKILWIIFVIFTNGAHSHRSTKPLGREFDLDKMRLDNLECHNKFRIRHGVPLLVQNDTLNESAQNYAESLAFKNIFEHSNGADGENLHWSMNYKVDGNTACKDWYKEIKDYNFSKKNPDNFGKVGHFTQLVWKTTRKLGFGVAKSNDGATYIVARYSPPGNYMGQYPDNVFKNGTKNINS